MVWSIIQNPRAECFILGGKKRDVKPGSSGVGATAEEAGRDSAFLAFSTRCARLRTLGMTEELGDLTDWGRYASATARRGTALQNHCAAGARCAWSFSRRVTLSLGTACRSSRKAALVQPNPITFMGYPSSAWASEERVTPLYFS